MMAIVNDKTLRVQGKVDPVLLQKFLRTSEAVEMEETSGWFFIDYSPTDFSLKTAFNLFFSSSRKIPDLTSVISIETVYDSFGHLLEEGIPKGFKTIVKLRFSNRMPGIFGELPVLKGWQPTANEILMTSTENIEFNVFPELLNDLAQFMVSDLQENYYPNSRKIGKKEFINSLTKSGLKNSENLLAFLTLGGFIREDNNEVELILHK